ncbi:MAG TPA: hypothetical protein VJB57_18580 [Dehalococcoidia bacterium]|nr:hypothetical protein [Dehalococcoidia bacterium]
MNIWTIALVGILALVALTLIFEITIVGLAILGVFAVVGLVLLIHSLVDILHGFFTGHRLTDPKPGSGWNEEDQRFY